VFQGRLQFPAARSGAIGSGQARLRHVREAAIRGESPDVHDKDPGARRSRRGGSVAGSDSGGRDPGTAPSGAPAPPPSPTCCARPCAPRSCPALRSPVADVQMGSTPRERTDRQTDGSDLAQGRKSNKAQTRQPKCTVSLPRSAIQRGSLPDQDWRHMSLTRVLLTCACSWRSGTCQTHGQRHVGHATRPRGPRA
jgi:hypothetical protein